MWLTLLLCLPLLDGGLRCAPRALAYPLPSPEACLRVGRQMVALGVQLPPGHRWLLPARPCSARRRRGRSSRCRTGRRGSHERASGRRTERALGPAQRQGGSLSCWRDSQAIESVSERGKPQEFPRLGQHGRKKTMHRTILLAGAMLLLAIPRSPRPSTKDLRAARRTPAARRAPTTRRAAARSTPTPRGRRKATRPAGPRAAVPRARTPARAAARRRRPAPSRGSTETSGRIVRSVQRKDKTNVENRTIAGVLAMLTASTVASAATGSFLRTRSALQEQSGQIISRCPGLGYTLMSARQAQVAAPFLLCVKKNSEQRL